jgi:pyruvate dehydrogenase E2 component (dihydrolipoamide acetyltransferase)
MIKEITMPTGGQNTDEALLVKWHFDVGEKVNRGDILFDIETDKMTLEIESFAAGYLLSKKYDEDSMIKEGEIVALIGDEKDKERMVDEKENDANQDYSSEINDYQPIMTSTQKTDIKKVNDSDETKDDQHDVFIKASPLAKKIAREKDIKLEDIAYAGSKIIHKIDVLNHLETISNQKQEVEQNYTTIPHASMRKIIAYRMINSLSTSAHYSIFTDIDMTKAIETRELLNAELKNNGVKISFNDIIIKCAAKAIKDVPTVNSSFFDDHMKVWDDVNFGVAVAVNNGIIVPVVHKCQNLSLTEIAQINADNIVKAKDGTLKPEKMSGGTITLSSMGMLGVGKFTSIINQPESTILSIGAIEKKAVVTEDDQIVARPIMVITSTFDHRGIDGAVGAEFSKMLKKYLENPIFLLA